MAKLKSTCSAWAVSIFMAGDIDRAKEVCRQHCDEVGLCVTVTPTSYIYTDGQEAGFIVGLINYPRYPTESRIITKKAEVLADILGGALNQRSYSIQTPETCYFYSVRPDD